MTTATMITVGIQPVAGERFLTMCGHLLLAVLAAGVIVAWSPRYWPVALVHAGILAIGIAWLIYNLARPAPLLWTGLFLPMFFVALWAIAQIAVGTTVYRFPTVLALLYWSANAAAMFFSAQLFRSPRVRQNFLVGLAAFTGLIAAAGILQYFTSPGLIYWTFPLARASARAVGPFVYRNQFAAVVELVLPIAIYRSMSDRRGRWAFSMVSAILFAVVVATASRAGTLLVTAEMILLFILGIRRRLLPGRALAMVLGQILILGAIFTLVFGFHDVWSRFQESNPYALRGKLAESTVRMIAARPLMGSGLGTWQIVYPEFATFDNSLFANEAHNDWAQWTAEGGIFFGLALAMVATGASILAWRYIWGLGVIFVFIHSLIDYPIREPVIAAMLFVVIGALCARNSESRVSHGPEAAP